jgi:hypothetical protein
MSEANVNALERDVEQARARFADDLARLRFADHSGAIPSSRPPNFFWTPAQRI